MYYYDLLKAQTLKEGESIKIKGVKYIMHKNILRQEKCWSEGQNQTGEAYGFMWSHQEVMSTEGGKAWFKGIMAETYPNFTEIAAKHLGRGCRFLDAGCGAGNHVLHILSDYLSEMNYLGVEISGAVDSARQRFHGAGFTNTEFMQADLNRLPFEDESFDFVLCSGVLHHTPSVAESISNLAKLLKPGGGFLVWVYRDVPPLRKLADDYIRSALRGMSGKEMLETLTPLTELARAFSELNATIDVPKDIPMLGIKAGSYDVQRFLNYNLLKMFYNPELPFERSNLYTYDWYAPEFAHTHSPKELESFFNDADVSIQYTFEPTPTGITMYGVKRD